MKQYFVKTELKQIKLWQNDQGDWQADGGLDALGFTYDPDLPEENRVYELEYLVAHGDTPEIKANDLAKQFAFLKDKDASYAQLIFPIILKNIRENKIKPKSVTLPELENILIALSSQKQDLPKLIDQNIIEVLGLDDLPYLEKKEMLDTFTQTIMQSVFLREASKMPKETREEFLKVLETKNEEEIGEFLKHHCADLDKVVVEEALKFKFYIINHSQKVDKKITLEKMTNTRNKLI